MGTLEELVAATKILGESAGKVVEECDVTGVSALELGENGFEVSKSNKVDGDIDHSIFATTKGGAVETETTLETTSGDKGRLQSYLNVEKHVVENVNFTSSGNKSVLAREEECDRNGINLIVDVLGSLDGVEGSKKNFETNGSEGSFAQNGEGLNITCVLEITGKDHKKDKDGEVEEKQEHGFCVGDFVWGKIKSHPWWPGQIYDSKDASDFAVKHIQSGRFLVAFFGDGSCSWCLPAQLMPFANNFEEKSKESSSRSFLNAVQRCVDEIGRVLESEMTCKCITKESIVGLSRPLVVNAGLKPGVLMPAVDIQRISIPRYEPAEVLSKVKNIAQAVSIGSMLDLAVLKSWLSSFYRWKGGYQLPMYYEAHQIEGLEDTSENGVVVANDSNGVIVGRILGPHEDDWLSSPSAGMWQSSAPSGDKIYRRRKQKSIAELMGETTEINLKDKKRTATKDETDLVKSKSTARKKSKGTDEENSGSHGAFPTRRGRKRNGWISGCSGIVENEVSNVESMDVGVKSINGGPLLSTSRENKVSAIDNIIGDEANQEPQMASTPRERKKSKYLSPPYTNLRWRSGNSIPKKESEIESEKIVKIARVGECLTKAAGEPCPSSSISNPVSAKALPIGQQKEIDSSRDTSCQHDENCLKKISDKVDADASGNVVLSKVQSAAVDPLYLSKEGSLNVIQGFFSAFRSSSYLEGSNNGEFHKQGKKRKSLQSDPENQGNDLTKTKVKTPKPRMHKAGTNNIEQATNAVTKLRKTARVSGTKAGIEEIEENASSLSLVLTFSPEFTLPSKDDIIRMFSKFGSLNEKETNVYTNSNSVQVVYVRTSDTEAAFRSSVEGLFGSAILNCRLLHSSATPEKPDSSQLANAVVSDMGFIKQKLEAMTRMLENCGCEASPKKSSLKDEMKHLLENVGTTVDKVKTMFETASV